MRLVRSGSTLIVELSFGGIGAGTATVRNAASSVKEVNADERQREIALIDTSG